MWMEKKHGKTKKHGTLDHKFTNDFYIFTNFHQNLHM